MMFASRCRLRGLALQPITQDVADPVSNRPMILLGRELDALAQFRLDANRNYFAALRFAHSLHVITCLLAFRSGVSGGPSCRGRSRMIFGGILARGAGTARISRIRDGGRTLGLDQQQLIK